MQIKTAFVLLATLATAASVGCGGSSSSSGPLGTVRASLHRAKSCPDLLGDLKADAIYKLNKGIDQQIAGIRACLAKYGEKECAYYGGYYGMERGFAEDAAMGGNFGGIPQPTAPPQSNDAAAESSGTTGGSSSGGAASYSQTNTQVKGVDEADIVKNDGKNIYILHGNSFKVVNAWPANELKEVGTHDIEGTPTEMFVDGGKVVVYSQVNGAKIFTAAGVQPKDQYQQYYGYVGGGDVAVSAPASDGAMIAPYNPNPAEKYIPLTKLTVLQLDGTAPRVTREVYFEGAYLDSRRVGQHVRTVFQGNAYGPKLKHSVDEVLIPAGTEPGSQAYQDYYEKQYPKTASAMISALEQLRAANTTAINASVLGDWLPYTFMKEGAGVSAKTIECSDFYVPTVGSTENGITEVSSIDLNDPAALPRETGILGRAETVYSNADTLYVAAQAWVEPPFAWDDRFAPAGGSGGVSGGSPGVAESAPAAEAAPPMPTPRTSSLRPQSTPAEPQYYAWSNTKTHIHKFEFATDPKFPNYQASGTIRGAVKDQFSLDDKDGFLRVATTETRSYVSADGRWGSADFSAPTPGAPPPARPSTVTNLSVLQQSGPWLDEVGFVGELAPNERIFSTRFVGNRGYVVTFRQVDPLFVFDLATPQKPTLLAALKIDGFSEYMHPLGDNHILTIGRAATAEGRQQGLQLQIFDVTNGADPRRTHVETYTGDEYGSSDAEHDHKAFTFFAEKGLLAFPYYAYNASVTGGMRSSLEIFRVDAVNGFEKLGSVDATNTLKQSPTGYCGGWYGPTVRRGVFLENFVYAITYGGVVAKDSNALKEPGGSELKLASPKINDGYGPYCAPEPVAME